MKKAHIIRVESLTRGRTLQKTGNFTSEWQTIEHAFAYLARADKLPHRTPMYSPIYCASAININLV